MDTLVFHICCRKNKFQIWFQGNHFEMVDWCLSTMEPEGFAPFSSKRRMTFHVILGCAWKKTGSTLVFSTGPDVEIWSSNSTFGGLHFFFPRGVFPVFCFSRIIFRSINMIQLWRFCSDGLVQAIKILPHFGFVSWRDCLPDEIVTMKKTQPFFLWGFCFFFSDWNERLLHCHVTSQLGCASGGQSDAWLSV